MIDNLNGGGYYTLLNVKEKKNSNIYLDIYILIPNIDDEKQKNLLKQIDSRFKGGAQAQEADDEDMVIEGEVMFDDIKKSLTGYARIIQYTNGTGGAEPDFSDPDKLHVFGISEGQYENGQKAGYCRLISAAQGNCELGFFHKDAPKGKYCAYAEDGSFIKPEGLYDGEKYTKLNISNYLGRCYRT